jgi:hypothetical protein
LTASFALRFSPFLLLFRVSCVVIRLVTKLCT